MYKEIQPAFQDNLESLINENFPAKIAVAVSGGSDSVALLHLAHNWAKSRHIPVAVLSVNHNLRKEAADEIDYVRELATRLELEFIALSWSAEGKDTNLQARARAGRYDLMCRACADIGARVLLIAHHHDDFMENYLIRESRGSSVFGLSSSYSYFHNEIQILRPLFNLTKNQLTDYLIENNIKWFEDASNKSDKYQRNRIRNQLLSMDSNQKSIIEQKVEQVNQQVSALSDQLNCAIAEICHISNFGFAILDLKKFIKLDCIIRVQLIAHVITMISGNNVTPRYRSTEKILAKIESSEPVFNSLHGCIIETVRGKLLIYKEKSKITTEAVPLLAKNNWDNRFEITILDWPEQRDNLYISALSMEDYKYMKTKLDIASLDMGFPPEISNSDHRKILFTIPVIKNLEKIVAIPHISYYDCKQTMRVKAIFKPGFISRFTHFFQELTDE